MKTQIPIYRAKKIESDEYIEGQLLRIQGTLYICYETGDIFDVLSFSNGDLEFDDVCYMYEIDPSTLSIHFEAMLARDSNRLLPNGEKDLRVFASLNQNGKGGDEFDFEIYHIDGWFKEKGVLAYDCEDFAFKVYCEYEGEAKLHDMQEMSNFKITGIKQ